MQTDLARSLSDEWPQNTFAIEEIDRKHSKNAFNRPPELLTGSILLIYSLERSVMYRPKMQRVRSSANRITSEVRLRLLALMVAILGLVLAPLGRVG